MRTGEPDERCVLEVKGRRWRGWSGQLLVQRVQWLTSVNQFSAVRGPYDSATVV